MDEDISKEITWLLDELKVKSFGKFKQVKTLFTLIFEKLEDKHESARRYMRVFLKLVECLLKKETPAANDSFSFGKIFVQLDLDNNLDKLYDMLMLVNQKESAHFGKSIERLCQIRPLETRVYFRGKIKSFFKSQLKLKRSNNGEFNFDFDIDMLIRMCLNLNSPLALAPLAEKMISFGMNDITREISDSNSFLVDGYSLLIECMLNNQVDLRSGGQYLHLTFVFERYVQMFAQLSTFFFIVFFDDLKSLFAADKCLNLAANIILKHGSLHEPLGARFKFFKNFYCPEYVSFLQFQKPTFIMFTNLDDMLKLKVSKLHKLTLMSIYRLSQLKHLHMDVNLALVNQISVRSNRLFAFYTRHIETYLINAFHGHLASLNYRKEIEKYNENYKIRHLNEEIFYKTLALNAPFWDDLNELSGRVDARLTLYCLALIYSGKGDANGEFITLMLIKSIVQANIDLNDRAIRLRRRVSSINGLHKSYIRLFISSLGYILQADEFDRLVKKLKSTDLCDVFDGRLFNLVYVLSATADLNEFWAKFAQDPYVAERLRCCFKFLQKYLPKCPTPIDDNYCSHLKETFADKRYYLRELEYLCFKQGKTYETLQVRSIDHPLLKKLFQDLFSDMNHNQSAGVISKREHGPYLVDYTHEHKLDAVVEKFFRINKWVDNFKVIANQIKDKDIDANFNNEVLTLTINSFKARDQIESHNKLAKPTINYKKILMLKDEIDREDLCLDSMEQIYREYEQTHQLNLIYLEYLYAVHRSKFASQLKAQNRNKLERLAVKILVKMDEVWLKTLEAKFKPNSPVLDDTIRLIIEILYYFNMKRTLDQLLDYVNTKMKMGQKYGVENFSFAKFNKIALGEAFQLEQLSDHLRKEEKTKRDKRTNIFKPDEWQVEFLDAIDQQQSVLIIAPTSSGKTYASFYAMEKVINANDEDSVLVYVSPTKALVNQTASAIMKTFENSYKSRRGRNLCGVFTRDFRNNFMRSKIIVTVPQCLFILLLNFFNSEWPKSIRYVVFDEIHSMGGEEGTDIWEYLLLLIRCPFIALSATVGNHNELHHWLCDLEEFKFPFRANKKRAVRLIHYQENHTDLKRYLFTKNGLKLINPIGLINTNLVQRTKKLPNGLHLTPRECVQLYNALKNHEKIPNLDPNICDILSTNPSVSLYVTRDSVRKYEHELKKTLLRHLLNNKTSSLLDAFKPDFPVKELYPCYSRDYHYPEHFCRLIVDMAANDMLPCIVFCNNRLMCETAAGHLLKYLKKNNLALKNKSDTSEDDLNENLNDLAKIARRFNLKEINIKMFKSGIGWHHSGLTHTLKSVTESLFRSGKLKVVIATATLALGIHMPCKTVVFVKDEIYLDSFQYRQASGRAGRRGFDTNGNVIFFDIPYSKIERLIGSNVSDLRPHFPLSVTFAMQLFDTVIKSKTGAQNMAIDSVLYKSFWNFTYKSNVKQVAHNAVFSLHFLYKLKLLNDRGKFSTFSSLLERIHYHEPSNFVFYYLLINNVLHETISQSDKDPDDLLMEILCHFFNQHPVIDSSRKGQILPRLPDGILAKIDEYNQLVVESYSEFFSFLGMQINREDKSHRNMYLPLTRVSFANSAKSAISTQIRQVTHEWTYRTYSTSAFSALSGIKDSGVLRSKNLLYLNCTNSLNVDSKVFPLFVQENSFKLSDYALKFYQCDDVNKCISLLTSKEYGIMLGDLYNYLKDFKMLINSIEFCFRQVASPDDPLLTAIKTLNYYFDQKFVDAANIFDRNRLYDSDSD